MKRYLLLAAFLTAFCGSLSAQPNSARQYKDNPPDFFSFSSNALGMITLNPTLDFEIRLLKSVTLGTTIWWEVFDVEDRWGQVKLTYYFSEYAMRGFGLSVTGGIHRAYKESEAAANVESEATSATLGMLVSHAWRIGNSEKVSINPMIGFRKTLSNTGEGSPLDPYYPEARLNIGIVF